jgi:RNA polymerase sigma-70 factor (ECF subfamily)
VTTSLERHFFRREHGRLVAALARVFGVHNLALAEDVAQEALVRALEVWKLDGVPENPSGWLYKSAKNLAVDAIRKDRTARTYAPELGRGSRASGLGCPWSTRPSSRALLRTTSCE